MEDYPRTLIEFNDRFATEEACRAYLEAMRWPTGFVCPVCAHGAAWRTRRGLYHCRGCSRQTSVTAGTILHGSHLPLRLWFAAIWHISSQKYGANALGLQRVLGLGSYHTAWAWLHKLRRAMVRPGRDRLRSPVQVDETYVGGRKHGKTGRGAVGKVLVGVAVEWLGQQAMGRIRLYQLPDASAASLGPFVAAVAQPGSTIHTDDWSGYAGLPDAGFPRVIWRPDDLEQTHLIASLLKRWLLGTYQGAVRPSHLAYYLDEYTFRFNRRSSASRGKLFYRLLEQVLMVDPAPLPRLKGPSPFWDATTPNLNLDPLDEDTEVPEVPD
jgi:transposase-like protein